MATVTVCQQEQVTLVCHLIVILVSWGRSHSRVRQMGCEQTETEMAGFFCLFILRIAITKQLTCQLLLLNICTTEVNICTVL